MLFCWLKLLLYALTLPQFSFSQYPEEWEEDEKINLKKTCVFSSNVYEQGTELTFQ